MNTEKYRHVYSLNNDVIFQALDELLQYTTKSTVMITDVIEALNHICFANNPLTIQMSKERLTEIIIGYSKYNHIKKRRPKTVDISNFDLSF